MTEQRSITLQLPPEHVDVLLNLINQHPPAPLIAARQLFDSIASQAAEQMKKAVPTPKEPAAFEDPL